MIDALGNRITEEQLKENRQKNSSAKKINNKLKQYNLKFDGYICDNELAAYIEQIPSEKIQGKFYIDGFKENKKNAKIRYVPPSFGLYRWFETPEEAEEKALNVLKKEIKLYKWLNEYDFSNIYKVFKKTDPHLPCGKFDFSSEMYDSAEILPIITYLEKRYQTDRVYGIGYKNQKRIVVITKDIPHEMVKFAPAYYDLHIFKKDEQPQTIQHCITMPSYVDFIVNDIINDNGETIELQIQSNTSDYYKCDDNYYAYATIDKHYHLKMSTFVFSQRSSEKSCPSEEINQITYRNNYQYVATVDTNSESITPEEALQESKKRYQQQ